MLTPASVAVLVMSPPTAVAIAVAIGVTVHDVNRSRMMVYRSRFIIHRLRLIVHRLIVHRSRLIVYRLEKFSKFFLLLEELESCHFTCQQGEHNTKYEDDHKIPAHAELLGIREICI